MKGRTTFALAALALAALGSCAPRGISLSVESEAPSLAPTVAALAREWGKARGLEIEVSKAAEPAAKALAGARVVIKWMLAPETDRKDAAALIVPAADRAEIALAFSRWAGASAGASADASADASAGAWRAVPLLWDAWGLVGTPEELLRFGPGETADASALAESGMRGGSVAAAMGEAGTRQTIFWLAAGTGAASIVPDLSDPTRLLASSAGALGRLSAYSKPPTFAPGMERWLKADLENYARSFGPALVLGPYSWTRTLGQGGRRDFRPLASKGDKASSVIVAVLAGEVEAKANSPGAAEAAELLLFLLGKESQARLSYATGLLPVRLDAPNLDPPSAAARAAALDAASILPVDPEPGRGGRFEAWLHAIDAAF